MSLTDKIQFRYDETTDKPCSTCLAKKDCNDYIHRKHIENNDIWDTKYTCNMYYSGLTVLHLEDYKFLVFGDNIEVYQFLQQYNLLKMRIIQRNRTIKPLQRLDDLTVIVEIKLRGITR